MLICRIASKGNVLKRTAKKDTVFEKKGGGHASERQRRKERHCLREGGKANERQRLTCIVIVVNAERDDAAGPAGAGAR